MFPEFIFPETHRYNLFVSGLKVKEKTYATRLDAEEAMWEICKRYGINYIECRECDKHERVYTNHKGVRFYINRI